MIFVNKYADYSANSIGKVIIVNLDDTTKEIIAKYSAELSNEKKVALNDFVVSLKNDGVWDKLTDLWLPCLAANPSEALYNVKQDIATTAVDNAYVLDMGVGLKTASYTGTSIDIPDQPLHLTGSGITMLTVFKNADLGIEGRYISSFKSGIKGFILQVPSDGLLYRDSGVNQVKVEGLNWKNLSANQIVSVVARYADDSSSFSTDKLVAYVNGVRQYNIKVGDIDGVNYTKPTATPVAGWRGVTQDFSSPSTPISIVGAAPYLTDEEVATLNTAIVKFNEEFWAM